VHQGKLPHLYSHHPSSYPGLGFSRAAPLTLSHPRHSPTLGIPTIRICSFSPLRTSPALLLLTGAYRGNFYGGVARASPRVVPLCRGEASGQRQRKKILPKKNIYLFSFSLPVSIRVLFNVTWSPFSVFLHLRKTPARLFLYLFFSDFFGISLSFMFLLFSFSFQDLPFYAIVGSAILPYTGNEQYNVIQVQK